jgi:hypothetical protein
MMPDDDLRLAWQAARDGRLGMRDALLTLAVASSGLGDRPWAERCWRWLVAHRPAHPFAKYPTLAEALADPRIIATIGRLRTAFPPLRVRWLLQRADVLRGAYTGRRASLSIILDDLLGADGLRATRRNGSLLADPIVSEPPSFEDHDPTPPIFPLGWPLRGSDAKAEEDGVHALFVFYLSVLLGIAILLASALKPREEETRAA